MSEDERETLAAAPEDRPRRTVSEIGLGGLGAAAIGSSRLICAARDQARAARTAVADRLDGRFGPLGRVTLPVLFGVALGAAGAAFPPTRDAAIAAYDSLKLAVLTRPEYRIRWVEVRGAPRVPDADIVAALDLEGAGRAALAFDARAARRRIEALGWVARADVVVTPPQTLDITIVERVPAVYWREGGVLRLLDAGGAVIQRAEARDAFPDLPLLVGPGVDVALAEGLALHQKAESAGLETAALSRVGRRRWDLDLVGGPRLMLPEDDPFGALDRAIRWTVDADLLRREFTVVDLRLDFAPTARRAARPAPRSGG